MEGVCGAAAEPQGQGHRSGAALLKTSRAYLGLCHFLTGEHKEDIAGMEERKGQVQEGDVLAQHVHGLKHEHRAPWKGEVRREEWRCFWADSPECPTCSLGLGTGQGSGQELPDYSKAAKLLLHVILIE